ncbi:MAG TPA: hypothetical protein VF198_04985 [Vicinamibacterales bacterium]
MVDTHLASPDAADAGQAAAGSAMPPAETRRLLTAGLLILGAAGLLRGLWLTADPPTTFTTVGIVWHDEGAWVHNARNRALWGTWRTDAWNPVFVSPVFTALEYGAFSLFGVGTWQARTVPLLSGLAAIGFLGIGLAAAGGRRAALFGMVLLATNYVFVMWNRAALMESTMTALIVGAWAMYAAAAARPALGMAAGALAVLAWFTKAAAAFFIGALLLDAALTLALAWHGGLRNLLGIDRPSPAAVRVALMTCAGAAACAGMAAVLFVIPYWDEYRFYNWQMSVTRKPSYSLQALFDRATWIPIVHDTFTRMWGTLVAASVAVLALAGRWRTASPAERLLVLWLALALLELTVHDSGNERRYVMLVPALIALAALAVTAPGTLACGSRSRWIAAAAAAPLAYLIVGSLVRVLWLADVKAGHLRLPVRTALLGTVLATGLVAWTWPRLAHWLTAQRIPVRVAAILCAIVAAGDLFQYWQWAATRTFLNVEASRAVGRLLPAGTLVHGKLANGLSLENRIRPIFVGRGFGNYADRTTRDDVPFVLTYTAPYVGYEGDVIQDVLDAHRCHTVIASFEVAETAAGHDRAALMNKFGPSCEPSGR